MTWCRQHSNLGDNLRTGSAGDCRVAATVSCTPLAVSRSASVTGPNVYADIVSFATLTC